MDNQSGRLVNDKEIFIFKDDIEIQGLGKTGDADFGLRLNDDLFAASDAVARPHCPTIYSDISLQNPAF
jgi:hypothetical protein